MTDATGEHPPKPDQRPRLEPIGVHILGSIDPRTLSREQFDQSPDRLFHGSAKPIQFSPTYDYSSPEFLEAGDGSQTLGIGIYTTDSLPDAEHYSRVRQSKKDAVPHMTTLLPYRARMLDFRSVANPEKNGHVPEDLFKKWYEYCKALPPSRAATSSLDWLVTKIEKDYQDFLDRAKALQKPLLLRVMLDSAYDSDLKGRALPTPPYAHHFTSFMKEEGYDGLIDIEGGEGWGKNAPSYVFFNVDKINTYEGWQDLSRGAGN